ncbi:hypothetical protein C4588_01765 [Candidatus Parcubacteria bacterium]|nr:MAG: hypothetical protein C4588_01765 [Candidatus Parcubacteria bacterium]
MALLLFLRPVFLGSRKAFFSFQALATAGIAAHLANQAIWTVVFAFGCRLMNWFKDSPVDSFYMLPGHI